jgi:hypothetical protein
VNGLAEMLRKKGDDALRFFSLKIFDTVSILAFKGLTLLRSQDQSQKRRRCVAAGLFVVIIILFHLLIGFFLNSIQCWTNLHRGNTTKFGHHFLALLSKKLGRVSFRANHRGTLVVL